MMLLDDKFYRIAAVAKDNEHVATYTIELLADCTVYQGHFPGKPVCPGVCNIQTIKECAMRLLGENLCFKTIKQCRLTAVATPATCPVLLVRIQTTPTEEGYQLQASIYNQSQTYMELKGTLIKT